MKSKGDKRKEKGKKTNRRVKGKSTGKDSLNPEATEQNERPSDETYLRRLRDIPFPENDHVEEEDR